MKDRKLLEKLHFLYHKHLPVWLNADLGKVLNLPSFGGLPQWAVVGMCDIYIALTPMVKRSYLTCLLRNF